MILSLILILSAVQPETIYQQYCAECHGADRLGKTGPSLLPQSLHRLKPERAFQVIAEGRPATQMPAFKNKLSQAQIQSLVDLIYHPIDPPPQWDMEQIKSSRIVYELPHREQPLFQADVDNLFMVVESGDHHASLLDGDRFEVIKRFPTRFAVHGGPKWANGGRFIYFISRDGWVSRYDIYNLSWSAEVRAGINARNLAVSPDGRWLIVANYLPHNLVLFKAEDLTPIKIIPAEEAGRSSRVSAVYTANQKHSFIAALKDIPQIWQIDYINAPNIDVRKIKIDRPLDDFLILDDHWLVGSSRQGGTVVIDLDQGKKIAELDIAGMPHLSSAITWHRGQQRILATPNIKKAEIDFIDMKDWRLIKKIQTPGIGFFLRSHENTPYAWADVFFGPHQDQMLVIDKQTLEIIATLIPEPGKISAHVEFSKDGAYALVSIWHPQGAIVVYDAKNLKEIKRLPMNKPSGKYNVHNKLNRSEGTSH